MVLCVMFIGILSVQTVQTEDLPRHIQFLTARAPALRELNQELANTSPSRHKLATVSGHDSVHSLPRHNSHYFVRNGRRRQGRQLKIVNVLRQLFGSNKGGQDRRQNKAQTLFHAPPSFTVRPRPFHRNPKRTPGPVHNHAPAHRPLQHQRPRHTGPRRRPPTPHHSQHHHHHSHQHEEPPQHHHPQTIHQQHEHDTTHSLTPNQLPSTGSGHPPFKASAPQQHPGTVHSGIDDAAGVVYLGNHESNHNSALDHSEQQPVSSQNIVADDIEEGLERQVLPTVFNSGQNAGGESLSLPATIRDGSDLSDDDDMMSASLVPNTQPISNSGGGFVPPQPHQIITITDLSSDQVSNDNSVYTDVNTRERVPEPIVVPKTGMDYKEMVDDPIGFDYELSDAMDSTQPAERSVLLSPPAPLYTDGQNQFDESSSPATTGDTSPSQLGIAESTVTNVPEDPAAKLTLSTFEFERLADLANTDQAIERNEAVISEDTPSEGHFYNRYINEVDTHHNDNRNGDGYAVDSMSTINEPTLRVDLPSPVYPTAVATEHAKFRYEPEVGGDHDDHVGFMTEEEFNDSINRVIAYDNHYVAEGYENLLDQKISEIQRQAAILEQKYWGNKQDEFTL